jgi:hypothetical protein
MLVIGQKPKICYRMDLFECIEIWFSFEGKVHWEGGFGES